MIRRTRYGYGGLLALTGLLFASPAFSQAAQGSPAAQDKAAAPAKKVDDPGAKPDPNAAKPSAGLPGKPGDPTVSAVQKTEGDEAKLKDRVQRKKMQQDMERPKIAAVLRGQPMSEPMKQELERHARRLARLERVKAVATESKDTATADRASKLIETENARHDKFTSTFEATTDKAGAPGTPSPGSKEEKPAGKDEKGGGK